MPALDYLSNQISSHCQDGAMLAKKKISMMMLHPADRHHASFSSPMLFFVSLCHSTLSADEMLVGFAWIYYYGALVLE